LSYLNVGNDKDTVDASMYEGRCILNYTLLVEKSDVNYTLTALVVTMLFYNFRYKASILLLDNVNGIFDVVNGIAEAVANVESSVK
jgi:hypothetical protein